MIEIRVRRSNASDKTQSTRHTAFHSSRRGLLPFFVTQRSAPVRRLFPRLSLAKEVPVLLLCKQVVALGVGVKEGVRGYPAPYAVGVYPRRAGPSGARLHPHNGLLYVLHLPERIYQFTRGLSWEALTPRRRNRAALFLSSISMRAFEPAKMPSRSFCKRHTPRSAPLCRHAGPSRSQCTGARGMTTGEEYLTHFAAPEVIGRPFSVRPPVRLAEATTCALPASPLVFAYRKRLWYYRPACKRMRWQIVVSRKFTKGRVSNYLATFYRPWQGLPPRRWYRSRSP